MTASMRLKRKRIASTIVKLVDEAQRDRTKHFKNQRRKIISSGDWIGSPSSYGVGEREDHENKEGRNDEIAKFQCVFCFGA